MLKITLGYSGVVDHAARCMSAVVMPGSQAMHLLRYRHQEQVMLGCGWWRFLAMPSTAVSYRAA